METAAAHFWTNPNLKHLPTQKEVTAFIAELLGDQYDCRFAAALAAAIRPEGLGDRRGRRAGTKTKGTDTIH